MLKLCAGLLSLKHTDGITMLHFKLKVNSAFTKASMYEQVQQHQKKTFTQDKNTK